MKNQAFGIHTLYGSARTGALHLPENPSGAGGKSPKEGMATKPGPKNTPQESRRPPSIFNDNEDETVPGSEFDLERIERLFDQTVNFPDHLRLTRQDDQTLPDPVFEGGEAAFREDAESQGMGHLLIPLPPQTPVSKEEEEAFREYAESYEMGHLLIPPAPPTSATTSFNLPATPPLPWLKRTDRNQTPPAFIKEHYAPWLGRGLTQAHLRIDPPLYNAFTKWKVNNKLPQGFNLPVKGEEHDRELEKRGYTFNGKVIRPVERSSQTSQENRLYLAVRRRLKQQQP